MKTFRLIIMHNGYDVTFFKITRIILMYYVFICKEIHDNVLI